MTRQRLSLLILALSSLLMFSGCATWKDKTWNWKAPWSKPEIVESKYDSPTDIAVIWTPDILTVAGKPPVRGFGGRVYFYNARRETIPVEGQLVVYGFDDSNPETAARIPQKRFAFTPEQFTRHFSETELGASYSIWIPWDSIFEEQKTVSLLPVFTSVSGHHIVGQQSMNVLQGSRPEQFVRKDEWLRSQGMATPENISPVSYNEFEPAGAAPKRSTVRTTTIHVPSTLTQQMISAASDQGEHERRDPTTIAQNLEAYTSLQQQQQEARAAAAAQMQAMMQLREQRSPWPPSDRAATRLPPNQLQAPAEPSAQSSDGRIPWRQHPAAPQYSPPYSPSPFPRP